MLDHSPSATYRATGSIRPAFRAGELKGVRGWLLVLCVMLTLVGPAIAMWLLGHRYAVHAPDFAGHADVRFLVFLDTTVTVGVAILGIHAGSRLWRIRPHAVVTAKYALFAGLVADILRTTIEVSVGPGGLPAGEFVQRVLPHLIPGLLFFTISVAYLNRSLRVHSTYGPSDA